MASSSADPVETSGTEACLGSVFGDIEEGSDDYEIRWKWDDFERKTSVCLALWMGEDLTGKRIVVWNEQGIGDQLLFLTLLPIVLSKNPEEVVVEVSKRSSH